MARRILVVDDDPRSAQLLRVIFEPSGYECTIARSAQEGRQLLTTDAFDVVLLDLLMPATHGLCVLRDLRECSDAPFVMLCSIDDEVFVDRCFIAGTNDYLVKPFGAEHLLTRVQMLLDRPVASHGQSSCFEIRVVAHS